MKDVSSYGITAAGLLLAGLVFIGVGGTVPAEASGIDSASGVDLPISAGSTGNPVIVVGAGQNVRTGDVEFTGSVGIGTANPQAALDVIGPIRTSTGNIVAGPNAGAPWLALKYDDGTMADVGMGSLTIAQSWTRPPANGLYVQGAVGIGTSNPQNEFEVSNNDAFGNGIDVNVANTSGQAMIRFTTNDDTTTRWELGRSGTSNGDAGNFYLFNGQGPQGGRIMTITPAGNAWLAGTLAQASDQRLKENIKPLALSLGLAAIEKLNPVTYTWKDTKQGTRTQIGLLAQNVRKVLPELVSVGPVTPLTPNGALGVNYQALLGPVVEAIQEQQAEIATLKDEVVELRRALHTQEKP